VNETRLEMNGFEIGLSVVKPIRNILVF